MSDDFALFLDTVDWWRLLLVVIVTPFGALLYLLYLYSEWKQKPPRPLAQLLNEISFFIS